MSAVLIASGTRKVKNIKIGGTSTSPPVTLIIVDLQIAWEHKVPLKCFLRSVDKNGLGYTIFVGDADSNCYASVCEALKNAPTCYCYELKKEECVGHIQKRIKTALRQYKRKIKGIRLANGKSVPGKGRLTDIIINRILNYFGQCIRNDKGNLQGMQNNIWAIFKHMIQDDSISIAEQHANYPKYGWCKYWANNSK